MSRYDAVTQPAAARNLSKMVQRQVDRSAGNQRNDSDLVDMKLQSG